MGNCPIHVAEHSGHSFLRTSFSFEKKLRVKAPTQGRQIDAILALEMLKVTYIQGCDDTLGIFSS